MDRGRAESFGAIAESYDRMRPAYPPQLLDELMSTGPVDVLDVGCGTGKLGVQIAARGANVLGVEVDERMAVIARRHGLVVETGAFEEWPAAARRFDLLVSATAWHWIDPLRGAARAHAVLRPGSPIWLCWNPGDAHGELGAALDEVFQRYAPRMTRRPADADRPEDVYRLRESRLFTGIEERNYRWSQVYQRAEYLQMISTHSAVATLPADRRAALLGELGQVVDRFGTEVPVDYDTYAITARAVEMDYLTPLWLGVAVAAARAGVRTARVEQWLRDGLLVARRGEGGVQVAAQLLGDGAPVKGLPGVITLLRDARYTDAEITDWLFRADDSLPGTPIEALTANRGREIKRRAQVAGY